MVFGGSLFFCWWFRLSFGVLLFFCVFFGFWGEWFFGFCSGCVGPQGLVYFSFYQ